jgi:hypothetical protein
MDRSKLAREVGVGDGRDLVPPAERSDELRDLDPIDDFFI